MSLPNTVARDLLFVPQFRNTVKDICDVLSGTGNGDGAYRVLLRVVGEAAQISWWHPLRCV